MECLSKLKEILDDSVQKEIPCRSWECQPGDELKPDPFPIKVGKKAWAGVILGEDVVLDLGGKQHGSACALITVPDENKIANGKITLLGPDISEIVQPEIHFGMAIIIACKNLDSREVIRLHRRKNFSNEIEGAIQRFSPRKYWIRLSRLFHEKHLSFQHLGKAFMHLFSGDHGEAIKAIEIVIISDSREAVQQLANINESLKPSLSNLRKESISRYTKLRDDCDYEWDCNVCNFQSVCEEIREIQKIRESKEDA